MRFNKFFAPPSKHRRRSDARKSSDRRLCYESLENRRLLAGVSASKAGTALTIEIDGNTEPAFVKQIAPGVIEVHKNASGTLVGTYTGITRVEIYDANLGAPDGQSVTFLNPISLPDGLLVDYDIETTNIDGAVTDVALDSEVFIGSDEINLNADILTDGGEVNLGHSNTLNVMSNVTIATGRNGAPFAGDVDLDAIVGPGGLTIDATAVGGDDGDVSFDNVGVNGPLAYLTVSTTGELLWWGRRIRTNGDVKLSASYFHANRTFSSIDSQSLPNTKGGDVELNFISVDADLLTLRVSTLGNGGQPDGTATMPLDFERNQSVGSSEVFQDPAAPVRIFVNASAVTPTILFDHNFTNNAPAPSNSIQPQSGTNGNITGNRYHLAPTAPTGNAFALVTTTPPTLPAKFALSATINMSGTGKWSNGLLIFDFIDKDNYKYAGAADGLNQYIIGEVKNNLAVPLQSASTAITPNININLRIEIRGNKVDLFADGSKKLTQTFAGVTGLPGKIGFGTMQSNTSFDDLLVTSLI